MRYCRFLLESQPRYGIIEEVAGADTIVRLMEPPVEDIGTSYNVEEDFTPIPLDRAKLLTPATPSKIVCVGRNYRDHASELGNDVPSEPLIFLKPPSSIIGPEDEIVHPSQSQRVDYEGELAIVIDAVCAKLAPDADVRRFLRGFTIVNDVTARDLQKKDSQWTRAKGFDTFCPIGPIVTDEIDPYAGVEVTTTLNGETRQHGNTREFIFDIPAMVRYIADVMTLFPGDVIATGTPAGVSPMKPGDVVEVTIPGIGTLRNRVKG